MTIYPVDLTMVPDSEGARLIVPGLGEDKPMHVSKAGSQASGVLSTVIGVGISFFAL